METNVYYLENRLKEGNPELHRRMRDSIVVLKNMLDRYLVRFPDFTDHSMLHSLDVIEYCNSIIGKRQTARLLPEECYVLLMSCYLHDTGMGISGRDYEAFSEQIDFGDYFRTHDASDEAGTVRAFHHEYSGLFIRKYAYLFDLPGEEYVRAIVQVSRGHRKTDLLDREEYADIPVTGGVIRTAYLAAVLRLADEIDVASARNPELLFDISRVTGEVNRLHFGLHESVRRVEVKPDEIDLYILPKSPEYMPHILELIRKIRETLAYCREAAERRSDLRIPQKQVQFWYEQKFVT